MNLFADTIDSDNDIEELDIQALREWVYTKRQVTVAEKGGALSISGEVRSEFQKTGETKNGITQRGSRGEVLNDGTHVPSGAFDIEVNLMLDYRADRTWGAVKLEFDNDAGIFNGTLNKLKLERAFIGARALEGDAYTFDLVFGRNRMSSYFDSKLEFGTFFDGILVRYDIGLEDLGDAYLHAGPFVINERATQFGYVGELGLLNIGNTGFYSKLSLIDWDTKHFSESDANRDRQRFDFIVSQLILGYKFVPQYLEKTVILYLAGLYNFAAKPHEITDHKKANYGSYLGFSIGELRKKGDYALDVNYQVLAAQCVPDFDSNGIGIGNASGSGFYTTKLNGSGDLTTRQTAGGNVNYRGFAITLEYLLTNNLNLLQAWQQSITLDKDIGPFRRFKQYEIELIYLF
jgi:hypothetical protein